MELDRLHGPVPVLNSLLLSRLHSTTASHGAICEVGILMEKCPFCGAKDEKDNFEYDDAPCDEGICVRCQNCGAYGPWADTAKKAEELWNKRDGK